ncbi:MAG: hypothetical protein KDG55_04840 [Rhodocyclaceae bacterium]|nr:hypothetical protein [Rhodocyclaceae bacterium]
MPEAPVSPEYILSLANGFAATRCLLSAVEFDLFGRLAVGPADLTTLEKDLGLHPRASRDFLDTLVALGLVEREDGLYANTPPAAAYLVRDGELSIVGLLEMLDRRLYGYWTGLSDALRSGRPQNELRHGGESLFTALAADPPRQRQFLRAMTALSRKANQAIARRFPWQGFRSFADLGCAEGDLALQIALAHPHLQGTGFDLPSVRPAFQDHVTRHGAADRLRFQAGDFFADPLPPVDVLCFGHILHDWSLDQRKALIARAHAALPPDGALIIYDAMIDDAREANLHALLMSLTMLIETPAGADYTGADCQAWLREAGFREVRCERLGGADSMVVGFV